MPFTQNLPANRAAFLDTIAWSEIGAALLAESDNGYNVDVGSTPTHPILFSSYAAHPAIFDEALDSTAAGRYQIIRGMFNIYKIRLSLPDFSPSSQDAIALQMLKERADLTLIDAGKFQAAILAASPIWASFPGSTAGQHTQTFTDLANAYKAAGGTISV